MLYGHKKAIGVILLCVLVASIGLAFAVAQHRQAAPELPAMKEITQITASLDGSVIGQQAVPKFQIPKDRYDAVLQWFSPIKQQPLPDGCIEVGSINISYKGGNDEIKLYWYGTSPALFTFNGIPCVRGGSYVPYEGNDHFLDESLAMYGAIRDMANKKEERLADLLRVLSRSAGRK